MDMKKTNIATRDNHSKSAILLFNKWFDFTVTKHLTTSTLVFLLAAI